MKLLVDSGYYEADSFAALIWEVLKHRCWHLWHDGRWID